MKTQYLTDEIGQAAEILARGGLVAVPTETVYGLAGDAVNEEAAEKIYIVKGRPEGKALSVMVPDADAIEKICRDVPGGAYVLARKFWPGPLTIVLPARCELVPSVVRAGGNTVALRCPACETTLSLLRQCDFPLAVPSANPSGRPSPKSAQDVAAYFDGKIDAIIDAGPCAIGTESTIVDLTAKPYRILRQGALSAEEIQKALIDSLCIVGITGGTGTGKTTALEALQDMGALLIDADAVYHELCRDNKQLLADIEARFPGSVENGELQRKKLGAVVFADAAALADLTAITDRYIQAEINARLAAHAAAGGKIAAVDAITLLEGNLNNITAFNVGITAPEEIRVKRLMARDNISAEYALLRIRAQKPKEYFEQNCDYTICNDSTREEYRRRCDALFNKILEGKI